MMLCILVVIFALVMVPNGEALANSSNVNYLLSGGGKHSMVVTADGSVWAWGGNYYGQLGDGLPSMEAHKQFFPEQCVSIGGVRGVSAGNDHTLAVKNDGTVWAWGSNLDGQLGYDVDGDKNRSPAQIPALQGFAAVAAGWSHSLALKSDGTVWAWGDNFYGELGDGTRIKKSRPLQIKGLNHIIAISAGNRHGLALRDDGTVWAWGYNSDGQVGTGTNDDLILTPMQVQGLTDIVAISGGGAHSLAVKSDGTVWGWGRNSYYELGDGTISDKHSPIQMPGIDQAIAVASGGYHSLILKSDGTVWACGDNGSGQLGDGTTADRALVVQDLALSGIVAIDAGNYWHSLALKSDGSVWAWGYDYEGEVGNGGSGESKVPTPTQVHGPDDVGYFNVGDLDKLVGTAIVVEPEFPIAGEQASFDASGLVSYGPDITSYNWFFGDGTFATGLTDPHTTHIYDECGTYTVSLQVKLSDDSRRKYSKDVTVTNSGFDLNQIDFNYGNTGGTDKLIGPQVTFGGKTFNLFELPIGCELGLFHSFSAAYNGIDKKFEVTIGLESSDYEKAKDLFNMCGKASDRQFYDSFKKVENKISPRKIKLGGEYTSLVAGYMEFDMVNGNPVLTEGGLVVVANASGSAKYPLPPCPAVYLKFSIEGEVNGKLRLKLVDAGQIDVSALLGLKVKPALGIGAGKDRILDVEAGLEGTLATEMEVPVVSLRDSFTATLAGNVYLKYEAFSFINRKNTWQLGQVQLYPRPITTQSISIEPNDFVLMPRDYLGGGRLTVQGLNELSLDQMNSTAIKSGVFPYSQSQLRPLGNGKQLLIWVDDKTDRSLANRTALMYSVYDGSSWSSPAYVNDDDTSDFAPRAVADNGQIYLTWQNANTTFADTVTLEEMAQAINISYARFDGSSFTDIANLTSATNTTLEMSPVISANGSEVTIAWIENSSNDPFGLTGANIIKTITSTGGVWGEPQTLVNNLPLITSLDAGYHNGAYILAYTVDVDGDISTNSDTELFLINTATPTRITTDAVDDSGVQFVRRGASSQIYWQSGDEIKSLSPDDNVVNTMSLTTPANQMRNLHIVYNDNEDKALVWEQSDGFKNELFGAYYDTPSSTWGGAIKLTALEGNIRQSSCYLDNDNTIQTAFDLAQVLEINENNSEPYGSTDLMVGSISRDINLSIDGGVYYDQQLLQPNSTINLNISIKNNSADPVTQIEADILDQTDQILSTQSITADITSGATQDIEIPYTLPAVIAKQDLKVQIRPSGVADIDMSDNQVTFTFGFADVDLMSTEVLGGNTPDQIQVDIQNIGYDEALNIVAALQQDGADGEVLDTQSIDSLAAGATQTLEFNLDPSWLDFASERDNKLFYVSLTTESPEGQYGNNGSLVVVSPPHVTDVSLSQTTLELAVGSTAPLQATVKPSEALNQNILWWSEDELIATVDENGTVTGLKAGQTAVYAVSFDGNKMGSCALTITGLTGYTLSGQILVEGDDLTEGQLHYSGRVSIELKQGEEIKYSTTSSEAEDLASNGSFSLTGIAAGDYTVVISKAGYLTRSFALSINSDLTLSTTSDLYHNRIYLWAGDIVSDDYHVIAAADVNYILSKFNSDSTQAGFDPQVDIVKDQYNVISAMDVNLMLSNFNKNSTQYPADITY